MTIDAHITEFAGLPVKEYSLSEPLSSPGETAFRLRLDWDSEESFTDMLAAFTADPGCVQVRALIVGRWDGADEGDDSSSVIEAIVSVRDQLPKLRAFFLGEMICEESEVSWITQSDVSPLFEAFPELEELWVRGGNDLSLGRPRHRCLKKLVIESGGLPATVVREVAAAELPELEHLELWLGDEGYGNDVTGNDLRPLLRPGLFPKLTYLGLRDNSEADATAKLLAEVGIPGSVETLDLSLGALGDEGAKALAGAAWIRALKKLDLHHHFISSAVIAELKQLGPEIDDGDAQEADSFHDGTEFRFVAVSE